MKVKAQLWVRLKVTDLVAQTAWMTLAEKMNFDDILVGLTRYSYWSMSAEGGTAEAVSGAIDREIRMDSAFTNQNKHVYYLEVGAVITGDLRPMEDLPRLEGKANEKIPVFICDIFVTEQGGGRSRDYEARLNSRLENMVVSEMKSGEIWRLLIRAKSSEEASSIAEKMAVTRSRREGLLLNPHYQEFELSEARRIE
jgi:hypothetical protein